MSYSVTLNNLSELPAVMQSHREHTAKVRAEQERRIARKIEEAVAKLAQEIATVEIPLPEGRHVLYCFPTSDNDNDLNQLSLTRFKPAVRSGKHFDTVSLPCSIRTRDRDPEAPEISPLERDFDNEDDITIRIFKAVYPRLRAEMARRFGDVVRVRAKRAKVVKKNKGVDENLEPVVEETHIPEHLEIVLSIPTKLLNSRPRKPRAKPAVRRRDPRANPQAWGQR